MKEDHREHNHTYRHPPPQTDPPLEAGAGQPVENVKPDRQQGRDDVRPIQRRAEIWIFDDKEIKPHQSEASEQQDEADAKKQISDPHRPAVGTGMGVPDVSQSEDDKWQDQQQSEDQMTQEHELVEIILISDFLIQPLEKGNAGEVNRIGPEQRHQAEYEIEEQSKPRANGSHVLRPGGRVIGVIWTHEIAHARLGSTL